MNCSMHDMEWQPKKKNEISIMAIENGGKVSIIKDYDDMNQQSELIRCICKQFEVKQT